MNSWIPKNKILKMALIAMVFSMALYFIILFLVIKETKKVKNFYQDTNSDSFKQEKFLAIKYIAESNRDLIQTLKDFFVQKGDEIKFIEEIELVANKSGVDFEIESIDLKADENDQKENIIVKIKTNGSWVDNIKFIDNLKKMSFGVLIQKVSLDADKPGNWSGFVEFIIFREK